ncbi:MAG TPA: RdgB/HAM1 family non-canonical purine NTP pyrophosphatase [Candidatus Dormibacteraeota bacterium]|nr:RdgB/HAM1 family non-canonical purine NTP pyrophosphatase [Candidatus Dormibacteraeota bacterium]
MSKRPRLVIASGNAGKIGEFRDLLSGAGVDLVAFDTDVDEVGKSYAANATLKAEAASARTGLPAIGDDSGVEVDALDGFPGLLSARLGPTQKERTAELLKRLEGKPRPWTGRFVSVIALAVPGRPTRLFEGEVRGEVVPEWRGRAGFGYDPVFEIPGTGKTFGEMPPEEKRKYSHRAAAARALLESGALQELSG